MLRYIDGIVLHCSATDVAEQNTLEAIRKLHTSPAEMSFVWGNHFTRGKGWRDIGYHYFIDWEGALHEGRKVERMGAHVAGHNASTIAICLAGNKLFNEKQFKTARALIKILRNEYPTIQWVKGHGDLDPNKTCPNFNISEVTE